MNLETDNKIQKKGITLVIPNPCGNIKETKMKNSGIEWIGEIPDGWEVSKIGQLYEERKTKVSDTVYPPLSVTMQGILPQLETAAKSDAHDDRKLVLKGDFAINSRSDRRGSCGISEFDGSVSLINTVLHPKTEMNPIYYNWLFHSFRFSDEYYKNGHGIVDDLWTTSWTEMKKIFIPLPPKETQQRIATYLDKKCSKIEETIQNQQQVIEKLKAYKQSLITEAVTGKVKIENGKACGEYESYKDSGVEWIGKIPREWDTIRIKWLLNERKERSEEGKEEPLSMSQKYGLIPTKEMETIPNMASTFVGAKLTYKDDIVFNKLKAHLGVFSVSKYDGLVSPDYAVYTSTGKADLKYLEYLFKTPQCISEFKKRSTGVGEGLTRLYTGELFSIYIPFPEKKTQKNIANFLVSISTAIDTAIEQKQKLIEKLTEYKKSLIYECVTGKKEI